MNQKLPESRVKSQISSFIKDVINQPFKLIIAVSLGLIALSLGYYFLIFIPKKLAYLNAKESELKACLVESQAKYNDFWRRECNSLGMNGNCGLPDDKRLRIDSTLKDDKQICIRSFEVIKEELNKLEVSF